MLQLSPELLLEILEALAIPLAFQTEQTQHRAALWSCSLVCKSWAAPSQRLLFERVQIHEQWRPSPQDRLGSFLATIAAETDKSRWLRESVLRIGLRPHASARPADIMAILTHLPNLRELNIIGPAVGFSEGDLAQLRRSGTAIRSLRVNADNTGSITPMAVTSWPAVLQLIAAIPTLRILDIISNYVDQLPSFTPALQLRLASFKLNTQWPTDASQFVASLIGGPPELFYQTGWAGFDLVGMGSAHLRSLSLEEPSTAPK
ncbi:hypothetical protein C8R46DRAFT_552723 [Mycena filopes]|nr:hypothetical protein C8R46DRAFT_552723 [Mycena filopes]